MMRRLRSNEKQSSHPRWLLVTIMLMVMMMMMMMMILVKHWWWDDDVPITCNCRTRADCQQVQAHTALSPMRNVGTARNKLGNVQSGRADGIVCSYKCALCSRGWLEHGGHRKSVCKQSDFQCVHRHVEDGALVFWCFRGGISVHSRLAYRECDVLEVCRCSWEAVW